jgi:hypothetical protein
MHGLASSCPIVSIFLYLLSLEMQLEESAMFQVITLSQLYDGPYQWHECMHTMLLLNQKVCCSAAIVWLWLLLAIATLQLAS